MPWLTVKKDYCEELRDSLDLVPIGAWRGNGRKAGYGHCRYSSPRHRRIESLVPSLWVSNF